jgi:hypothetical protein
MAIYLCASVGTTVVFIIYSINSQIMGNVKQTAGCYYLIYKKMSQWQIRDEEFSYIGGSSELLTGDVTKLQCHKKDTCL